MTTSKITTKYDVSFNVPDHEWYVQFTSQNPDHVKAIVSALSAFNSGDDCVCNINGETVVLEGDWGLA